MPGTIYLHLLIFCGIWFQGIIGTFAEEGNKGSSDFLARQKRVVSYEHGGARVVRIEEQPYIVHIKKHNRIHCMGTILSHTIVITTSLCAELPVREYTVVSKSAHGRSIGRHHNVTNKVIRNANIPGRDMDGIALLTINPAVVYDIFVRNIELNVEPLLAGMLGTVSGWGFNFRNKIVGPGTNYPLNLRSIEVPIISHRDCVRSYENYFPITDKDICTYHPLRHSGHTDGGAPLVINKLLVGIFLRSGPMGKSYNPEYPEVFALLQHPDYSVWIRSNI